MKQENTEEVKVEVFSDEELQYVEPKILEFVEDRDIRGLNDYLNQLRLVGGF